MLSERRHLTVLPLDGVDPSLAAMEGGTYRLGRPIYFVRGRAMPPVAGDFLVFVASPDGAQMLRPLGVSPPPPPS